MKASRRAQRKLRHYARMHRAGGLNLVSLMDIFTILVFFLMVNSSDVQVLNQNNEVKLPESTANQIPVETLVVVITESDIIVQGKQILSLSELKPEELNIPKLADELAYFAKRDGVVIDPTTGHGGHITIMGAKSLPYSVLKSIMKTCVDAQFTEISLAVNHNTAKEA